MAQFVDTTVKRIDGRLRELEREVASLEKARAVLTDSTRPGRRATSSSARANGRRANSTSRRRQSGNTRATQALKLVGDRPGITIPQMARAMKIQPNYLYRVLPRLAADGQVKREGDGWHIPSSSAAATPTSAPEAAPRRRGRAATTASSATATPRQPRESTASSSRRRRARRGTTASVLAALTTSDAMTASEVAAKAGLERPTVSTTLSKLAKRGRVEKAERGYRLSSAA